MSGERFLGFPPDGLAFYVGLDADNSKAYWHANKARYDESVRGPMERLLAELDEEFGPFRVFRPYNDVRFSKTKVPYKTHTGAMSETEGGAMNYLQFSANGLMAASGYYAMTPDQLDRFRRAVDDEARGTELVGLVGAATGAGYALGAIGELKTAPRGYPKDHPRIDLIRRKGLMGSRSWPVAAWLHTAKARQRIIDCWHGLADLDGWLDTHVGPSTSPPQDAGRW